jgi:hypothetical protein
MTQAANRQLEIVAEDLETVPDTRLTCLFAPAVKAAERGHRTPFRFVARHAGANEIVRLGFDMSTELVVESALEVVAS